MGREHTAHISGTRTTATKRETLTEWAHAMHMEFLRVPIMVPIWWAGMKLCDIVWSFKH
jgi:hypothetical protein